MRDSRLDILKKCEICPRRCRIDRTGGATGFCGAGWKPKLARAALHYWEEPCISGQRGSGAVFFSHCNLRCVFCQNRRISQEGFGREVDIQDLAEIFLSLQAQGAHNLNLVSPTQYAPQVASALAIAKDGGLSVPVVYNSNAYELPETLELFEGLVDVYLPDLKYCSPGVSERYSLAPDYFEVATQAIPAMFRQVGEPRFDDGGMIQRGLIVRHLVLPGLVSESRKVLSWIRDNLPPGVYVSLMSQYVPLGDARFYPEINRTIQEREYQEVLDACEELGIENGYVQELESAQEAYIPDFDLTGIPAKGEAADEKPPGVGTGHLPGNPSNGNR